MAAPQLAFNYLGRFAAGRRRRDWSGAGEGEGLAVVDAAMPLSHVIAVNALTLDGAHGRELVANWTLGAFADQRGAGAGAGGGLVRGAFGAGASCGAAACGRPQPERPCAGCAVADRDRAAGAGYPAIEDILPLTPLQEGLLFHALYDAGAPDVYTVQLDLELVGALDASALRRRWQAVVARHASLRACFWQDGHGDGRDGRCR